MLKLVVKLGWRGYDSRKYFEKVVEMRFIKKLKGVFSNLYFWKIEKMLREIDKGNKKVLYYY